MKFYSNLFTVSILVLLVTSCDPPHNINFINKSNSDARIKLSLNPATEIYELIQLSNDSDSIILNLKREDVGNIYFGIGTWSEWEINNIAESIISLEVETSDVKTIYKTQNAIKKLMKDNLKGLWWKTEISIEVK